jgi:hypothetical protein
VLRYCLFEFDRLVFLSFGDGDNGVFACKVVSIFFIFVNLGKFW